MARVFVSRLAFAFIVLVAVTTITFLLLTLAGDPARLMAGPQATAESVARLRVSMGLDGPWWSQYAAYMGRLFKGDLGVSVVTGRPVLDDILQRAPATVELMICALVVAVAVGAPLGIWAARHKDRAPDILTRALSVLTISVPGFWLGMILVLIFYRMLNVLPAAGRFAGTEPGGPTGFLLLDTLMRGDLSGWANAASHLALPVCAIAVGEIGATARLVRSQMLGVLSEDYIRMARASGLSENEVIRTHAIRNALTPLITVLGLSLASMLYGSVTIETVFGWPGAGAYVVAAIFALDFPVILGFAVIASTAYVVVNLVVDLIQGALDPRTREGER